jgi:hypothetical protein
VSQLVTSSANRRQTLGVSCRLHGAPQHCPASDTHCHQI